MISKNLREFWDNEPKFSDEETAILQIIIKNTPKKGESVDEAIDKSVREIRELLSKPSKVEPREKDNLVRDQKALILKVVEDLKSLPSSREVRLALTRLEEAAMWLEKSIWVKK